MSSIDIPGICSWGAQQCICTFVTSFAHAARTIASQCALVRVRRASRALTRLYDESLRPVGLQASQLTLLVAVATCGDEGVMIGALADGLVMDRTTLTRNLVPLERAGLLRVARAPDDARVRLIFLTRKGERAIEAAFPLWEQAQKRIREQLGERETDALREELGRVVALTARPAKASPARTPRARATKAPPARAMKAPPARVAKALPARATTAPPARAGKRRAR